MPYFDTDGIISKLLLMLTFTKITENPTGINCNAILFNLIIEYLDHDIPYW